MEMTVWRITCRGLSMVRSERGSFSFLVATRGMSEQDAVVLARAQYTEGWWKDHILTDVEEVGRLKAAEGIQLPADTDDCY